jgi:RimJ/RimL family protein N-acetyltransferase
MPGPRITAEGRVTLRTFESDDLSFLQRSLTNPELRIPMGSPVKNREQLEAWIEDDDADRFVVCLDEEDAPPGHPDDGDVERIGAVFVADADWKRPDLAYWLIPEVHGEGYGKRAVALLVDHVFRTYDTPAVGAVAYDFNDASRGLLESLGFAEEGRMRKQRFVDGEHIDGVQYGLLREEWRDDS